MDLDRIFSEQRGGLARRLERMTGDSATAEDLCQETFVRAWRHAPRDAPPEVLRAWLHRTAGNLGVDELRRRARRPALAADGPGFAEAAPAAAEDGAAREALAALTAHERLVLLLRFEAGLSLRELGELLDISEEAARKRVARARERFRAALEAQREEPGPLVLLLVREEPPAPYEAWLRGAGARVRTVTGAGVTERDVLFADALVVPGAYSDVHPRVYGETSRGALRGTPDVRRDWRDMAAIRAALRADVPLIGVCRGHQLLNIVSGGTLYQDLDEVEAPVHAHRAPSHEVRTAGQSTMRSLVGARAEVPTEHHQAVRRVGRGLRVTATSPDGVVESIERTDRRFAVGLQWKPQNEPDSSSSRMLAEALVTTAERRAA
jgi:RNA polymerase sigma factor (sigma-70 family)